MSFSQNAYHQHPCKQCGLERIGCYKVNCQSKSSDTICMTCWADNERHLWNSDLTLMAKMVSGEIKLLHSIGACYECGKARLLQISYEREKEIDDLMIIIKGSVDRMKEIR